MLAVAQSDDVEERIGFLEAGADDVIAQAVRPRELEARVEALLLRFQRSAARRTGGGAIGDARGTRIVAVFSPKGGVGTTTIATNIALARRRKRHPDRVS